MEIILHNLESGTKGEASTANGYQFSYVVSGSCEYVIKGDHLQLEEGDSLYFDATYPHLAVNNSRRKVVILSVHFILPE